MNVVGGLVVVMMAVWAYPMALDDAVLGVEVKPVVVATSTIREARVLFVGDLLYDRSIRAAADKEGDDHIFSCLADEFRAADMVIANLENPVTANESVSVGTLPPDPNNFRFTAPMRTPEVLARHNIRAVTIGNNHIRDFGDNGIQQTRAALSAAGVAFVGDPNDAANTSTALTIGGVPMTLVAFNEFFGKASTTIAHINAAPAGSVVVVFAHWGDEYEHESHSRQRAWAHQFVDAGADLVVGAHPHVIQEREVYNGTTIYYSIGNFIFDNYDTAATTNALALEVTLSNKGISEIREHPILLTRDRRTCFAPVPSVN